jgi:hypothetical protein
MLTPTREGLGSTRRANGSADGSNSALAVLTLNSIQLATGTSDLHPRYEPRGPGSDLVLQVIDRNMADEVRGVHNLSGGERFLVSLALALGLASMASSRGVKVESLFIDEGFGALDSTNLAMAVSVLEQLQATGRRVGVISHVDELKERIAVKVEVTPVGAAAAPSRSTLPDRGVSSVTQVVAPPFWRPTMVPLPFTGLDFHHLPLRAWQNSNAHPPPFVGFTP